MGSYLVAVWKCRYFWLSLVKMDLRTRYRRSILGIGWSLLQPIAMTVILSTVFAKLLSQNVRDYAPYVMTGLAFWNYILSVTLQGCQCFFLGESYIRQHPAPTAIYPLRTALGATFHFLIALGLAIALTWFFQGFGNLPALVSLIPSLILLFILSWSVAVLAGFANVFFQDTQHLTEVGFQILFYATPIIYYKTTLMERNLGWVAQCNPVVTLLDLIRLPILEGVVPSATVFATASGIVFVVAAAAALTLSQCQRRLIFYL